MTGIDLAAVAEYDEQFAGSTYGLSGRTSLFTLNDVRRAEMFVQMSGVEQQVVAWRNADSPKQGPGGRPAFITDRQLLTAMMLLAMEKSPLLVMEMRNVLAYRLDDRARQHLGVRPAPEDFDDPRAAYNW